MDMNDNKIRGQILNRLTNDSRVLIDALEISMVSPNECGMLVDDERKMRILQSNLISIQAILGAEIIFRISVNELEEEKSKFIVQKNLNQFINMFMFPSLNSLLNCASKCIFYDYRVRNFQEDLCRNITAMCDWYRSEYNIH